MSNLAEQNALTAASVARGDYNPTPTEVARHILDQSAGAAEIDNTTRAAHALLAFFPSYDDAEVKTGLIDCITDILHLCDLAGFSFAEVEKKARTHYQRELMAHGAAHDIVLRTAIEQN